MREAFAVHFEKNLISRGYAPAEGRFGPARSFYLNDGGILYIVTIIPGETTNFADAAPAVRALDARFEATFKNIFYINIFLLNEEADTGPFFDFLNDSEAFSGQKSYVVNWGVQLTKNGHNFFHSKNQPDKVSNLRGLIEDSADAAADGRAVSESAETVRTAGRVPVLTYILIVVCGLYLAAIEMNGGSGNIQNLLRFGALYRPLVVEDREFFRLFTAMFLHIGPAHYLSNALGLYIIGTRTEKYFGALKFIFIYFLSGVFGNLLCLLLSDGVLAGASGAVFGAEGALLAFILKTGKPEDGFPPLFILIFVTAGLCFSALFPNVANYAHAGGLFCGFLLGWALCPRE